MSRLFVRSLHVIVALVTLTGVVFAWMKYFMHTDDPFAVANHPWQPYILDAHVILAPLLVFWLGWLFSLHIGSKFISKAKKRRKSGLLAMWLIAPMIFTGYLLQVFTTDALRKSMAIGHWITSAVFVLGYLAHQLAKAKNGNGGGHPGE